MLDRERRLRRILSVAAASALFVSACTSTEPNVNGRAAPDRYRGGVLRVGMPIVPETVSLLANPQPQPAALDPQLDVGLDSLELYRCCLLRTLFSHNGHSTNESGAVLRPDLATGYSVSADRLTWTFRLKRGIHYSPPLQGVEVTASDFVRAFQRSAKLAGPGVFSVIQGYDDFAAGKTISITGLETPDTHTLVVRLTQAAGDLAYRLTLTSASPIPPQPGNPAAPYGAATGHDAGDGPFLVGPGPYMLRGIEKVDFSRPPEAQVPAAGYVAGRSISLVRNPSWDPSTDKLRAAYPDRIEITTGDTLEQVSQALDKGRLDLMVNWLDPEALPDQIARYQKDPGLGRVIVNTRDFLRFVSMNLAVPPFDDLHVRKAVNLVIDKQAIVDARGPLAVQIAGHIVLDSLEDNLLVSYDPYRTTAGRGDVGRAKQEMKLSRYDADQDGVCDVEACRHVLTMVCQCPSTIADEMLGIVRRNLQELGIVLETRKAPLQAWSAVVSDPTRKTAVALGAGWSKDYLSASDFFGPLFSGPPLVPPVYTDASLVGSTPDELRAWGYQVTSVPSVDNRIRECNDKIDPEQLACWAALDTYLMEEIVPWVPLVFENHIQVVPNRVVQYSFDQLNSLPALDRIAVKH